MSHPIVLVTGGTRGIGAAICDALAPDHHLVIGGRDRAAVESACARYESAQPFVCDVADGDAMEQAVADLGPARAKASGGEAVRRMKAMPTEDDCFGAGRVREDGRKIHPAHLFEVKSPAESSGPWDYYKLAGTVPAEQAFRPLVEGGCPLLRR